MSDRIEKLKSTIQAVQAAIRTPYKNRTTEQTEIIDLWMIAFDEYNQSHERKLSMGCYPCYKKVIKWMEWQEAKEGSGEAPEPKGKVVKFRGKKYLIKE